MGNLIFKKKSLLNKIAQKHALELILLFGSRVVQKTHQESDFDIAYLSKRELGGKEEIELNCGLMPIFKSDKIDLVNFENKDKNFGIFIGEIKIK